MTIIIFSIKHKFWARKINVSRRHMLLWTVIKRDQEYVLFSESKVSLYFE